jgi:phosphatidylserine/phosphatidylglycerophosphate/cardiolipin synthase-like enzyme
MRLSTNIIFLLLSFLTLATPGQALGQGIIINELFNSSSSDEWVELLVVQDSLDLRNWNLRDFSSSGSPQAPLAFTSNALWSNLRAGIIIVVARPENTSLVEDVDASDFLLIVKSNNSLYFAGNPFLFAGSSDAFQIRTAADLHVIGVSWGAANTGSLPNPKVHFSGSSSSGTSISFNEDSLPELGDPASWTINNSMITLGTGNNATNAAWINGFRLQADGSGSASVYPDTLSAGETGTIQITYRRDPQFTVTDLRIIIPFAFIWSRDSTDVTFTNITATKAVNGDTIYLNTVAFGADSTIISLLNVTAPDSTAFYPFRVQSRVTAYANVTPIPMIVVFGAAVPIAEVKMNDSIGVPLRLGELVTIRGVVTVADQFGGPSYLQDNSGGIGIFGSSFSTATAIGDEVIVSGVVNPFNGLSELTSPELHSIVSSGNPVTPIIITCAQLFNDGADGVEQFEGLLAQINVVMVGDTFGNPIGSWAVSGSGDNYRLFDATGHVDIRVDNNVNFANTAAPQGNFDVIGVAGQFKPSLPYIGGYQLLPRFADDILATGPIIATVPTETNIEPNSLAITWTTVNPGTSRLRYGRTAGYEIGVIGTSDSLVISHSLNLFGLDPATVYFVQAFSVSGSDTSTAPNTIVSTASPSSTTGEINVYFNRSINASVSTGEVALGNQDLVSRLVTRINNAQRSIDAMIHSLSGSPGDAVAFALVSAKNRGVKVRVIAEYDNRITTAFNNIIAGGIPFITDRFDPINDGAGLMHNKTFVFDYRGGAPESVWVWTGSWNLTGQQTTIDPQNSIEIQDVALAGAYTLEFNEMWGSDTDIPDAGVSRFGVRKQDNTPHRFVIDGLPVSSYFSPGDRSTTHIKNTLAQADRDIAFSLFAFTLQEVADVLIAQKNAGKTVRGVMESDVPPDQFAYLFSNGIDVHLDPLATLLHHKYAIVDGTKGTLGPQWVITGSQNWSFSGENRNNENTLIVQSARVANLYLQEFAARYYEAGGIDSIFVSVELLDPQVPASFSLLQNYPNPFNPSTKIQYSLPSNRLVALKVYDLLGREVATLVNEKQAAGSYQVEFSTNGFASGVYFYRLRAGSSVETKKMLLMK